MWSLHAALDLRGLAFLRSRKPPARLPDNVVRNLVVPGDIVPVRRRSPIKTRKRTPWNPAWASRGAIDRGGSREWLAGDRFIHTRQATLPAACSVSVTVHVVLVIFVLLLLMATRAVRADGTPRRLTNVSLQMPSLAAVLPVTIVPPPAPKPVARSAAAASAAAAPASTRPIEASAAAPLETPSSIQAESPPLDGPSLDDPMPGGEPVGMPDGVEGGSPQPVEGRSPQLKPGDHVAPLRVGNGIAPPRKIKDVKPVYPAPAIAARVVGNVLIEVTIGVDGRVHDPRVIQSIAFLDQAALDAVRQWEFEPTRLNGQVVAVTMVIVVTFSLL